MLSRLTRPIRQLRGSTIPGEMTRFAVVGVSGVVVNNAALFALHGLLGWPLLLASPLAVEIAIVNNFLWNDRWTFSERHKRRFRFLTFNVVSIGGLVVNTAVLNSLVALLGIHYLVANLVGIGAATAWNFAANLRWTWRHKTDSGPEPALSAGTVTNKEEA